MKITIFTSNQPRHISLVNRLARIADEIYCVQESNTVFPGQMEDFYRKSSVMQAYFRNVMAAEKRIFGKLDFLAPNVKSISIRMGDLSSLPLSVLEGAMSSEVYIVFGASYIKGKLIDHLVERNALNIHMGISPYYRGTSCNFWALYDGNPNYVGATIHLISRGLDNGPILYHCIPKLGNENPFEFTMKSVLVAHSSLVSRIKSADIFSITPVNQIKHEEVRYTKNIDFTDKVASDFLNMNLDNKSLKHQLGLCQYPELMNPFFA